MKFGLFHFLKINKPLSIPAISILCMLVSACSSTGDFGRPRQYILQEYVVSAALDVAINDDVELDEMNEKTQKNYGVNFRLSQAEIALRDIALHYHQALTGRNTGYDIEPQPLAFAEHLTASGYTTTHARIDYIISQMRADKTWLRYFIKMAEEVKLADARRLYIIDTRKRNLLKQDRVRTMSRITENNQVIEHIFENIDNRLASYLYVIDRSEIETPGKNVFEARVELKKLRKHVVLTRTSYDKLSRISAKPFAGMSNSRNMMRVKYRDSPYYKKKSEKGEKKMKTNNTTNLKSNNATNIRNWPKEVMIKPNGNSSMIDKKN